MKENLKFIARKDNLVVQELENEVLIYDLDIHKALHLNETSALIWQACDGKQTVSEIKQAIVERVKHPVSDDLIWLALDQFKKENLIENKDDLVIDFNGLSRREIIRKIALGSMAALPLISTLIAPRAIHAASCISTGACACTDNNCRPSGCCCAKNVDCQAKCTGGVCE